MLKKIANKTIKLFRGDNTPILTNKEIFKQNLPTVSEALWN